MSADGSCEFVWAGVERKFRLDIDSLFALQERRKCGPRTLLNRLLNQTYVIEDLQDIILLGLIGAGEDAKVAKDLVARKIQPPYIVCHERPATAILMSALLGDPEEPVGKQKAAQEAQEIAIVSPTPPSTAPVLN